MKVILSHEEEETRNNIIQMATNKGKEILRDKNDIFANENANDDKTHNNSKDPPAIVKSDDTSKQDIKISKRDNMSVYIIYKMFSYSIRILFGTRTY